MLIQMKHFNALKKVVDNYDVDEMQEFTEEAKDYRGTELLDLVKIRKTKESIDEFFKHCGYNETQIRNMNEMLRTWK